MKLVKIKNKYIYKPDESNPEEVKKYKRNGSHIYAVYKDKETGELRAVQTTHLYEEKKVSRIRKGVLLEMRLPKVEFPSGVKGEYYACDINGDPIDLKKVKAINVGGKKANYLPKAKADKIKAFAKKRVKEKKKRRETTHGKRNK